MSMKSQVAVTCKNNFQRENIYTIPNFLCISRILISPYLGVLVLQAHFHFALAILGVAAVTDLVSMQTCFIKSKLILCYIETY